MKTIDADAHVGETSQTWEYLDSTEKKYRPKYLKDESSGDYFVVIEGKIRGRDVRGELLALLRDGDSLGGSPSGRDVQVPEGAFEMENVPARLADMDALGIDVQVLQPSLFIRPYAEMPATQIALCSAYARWMADLTKDCGDRLRWAAPLPLLSLKDAIDLLGFAHDNGAVSAFIRPIEDDKPIYDPYFYPLYDEVCRLNMALGVHVGNGNPQMMSFLMQSNGFGRGFLPFSAPAVGAFHGVVTSGLPVQFPQLRICFLETGAEFLPYVLGDLRRRVEWKDLPEALLRDYRLFVSCRTTDDLSYIMADPAVGWDSLVIGTDYGHNDVTSELDAIRTLRKNGSLDSAAVDNILENNPAKLYAL